MMSLVFSTCTNTNALTVGPCVMLDGVLMGKCYLQIGHAGSFDGIHCEVRAGKAHKVSLFRKEPISKQPPE